MKTPYYKVRIGDTEWVSWVSRIGGITSCTGKAAVYTDRTSAIDQAVFVNGLVVDCPAIEVINTETTVYIRVGVETLDCNPDDAQTLLAELQSALVKPESKPDSRPASDPDELEWMCPACSGEGWLSCPYPGEPDHDADCEVCRGSNREFCDDCNGIGWLGYEPGGFNMPSRPAR